MENAYFPRLTLNTSVLYNGPSLRVDTETCTRFRARNSTYRRVMTSAVENIEHTMEDLTEAWMDVGREGDKGRNSSTSESNGCVPYNSIVTKRCQFESRFDCDPTISRVEDGRR